MVNVGRIVAPATAVMFMLVGTSSNLVAVVITHASRLTVLTINFLLIAVL